MSHHGINMAREKGFTRVLKDASTFSVKYRNISLDRIRRLISAYEFIYDDVDCKITRSPKFYQLNLDGNTLRGN